MAGAAHALTGLEGSMNFTSAMPHGVSTCEITLYVNLQKSTVLIARYY